MAPTSMRGSRMQAEGGGVAAPFKSAITMARVSPPRKVFIESSIDCTQHCGIFLSNSRDRASRGAVDRHGTTPQGPKDDDSLMDQRRRAHNYRN